MKLYRNNWHSERERERERERESERAREGGGGRRLINKVRGKERVSERKGAAVYECW